MNEFSNALISKERSNGIPEEFDCFGQFVGNGILNGLIIVERIMKGM